MAPRRWTTLAIQMLHSKSQRMSLSLRSFKAAISKLTTVILKKFKGGPPLYKLMQFDLETASSLRLVRRSVSMSKGKQCDEKEI